MVIHFTVMIKENDTSNLKLLTEKLNEGFYINERIEVGRSTVLTLRKIPREITLGESELIGGAMGGSRPSTNTLRG